MTSSGIRLDFAQEGNIVRCIYKHGKTARLTVGKFYKIEKIHEARDDYLITVIADNGKPRSYNQRSFEPSSTDFVMPVKAEPPKVLELASWNVVFDDPIKSLRSKPKKPEKETRWFQKELEKL